MALSSDSPAEEPADSHGSDRKQPIHSTVTVYHRNNAKASGSTPYRRTESKATEERDSALLGNTIFALVHEAVKHLI